MLYPASQPSPREIEEQARALGMVYREEVIPWAAPEEPESATGPVANSPAAGTPPVGPTAPAGPVVKTIYISRGSTLDAVADQLLAEGIISDREAFVRTAQEQNLSRRLIAGAYTVQLPVSSEDLIGILTGQP